MRTSLRLFALLLIWTGLVQRTAWAQQGRFSDGRTEGVPRGIFLVDKGPALNTAQIDRPVFAQGSRPLAITANNVTFGVPVSSTPRIADFSTSLSGTSTSITNYTIVTRPASGTLYAYNATTGAAQQITANNTTYSAITYPNLAYAAPNSARTVTFTYTARDNNGTNSNQATYTIQVGNAAPTVNENQTVLIMPSSAAATSLTPPISASDDNSVASYNITSVPPTTQGVLALSGTAITAGQNIPAAQIGNVTFDPNANFFGTAIFTYTAVDNQGSVSAEESIYGIPVSDASCIGTKTFNFATRGDENWATAGTSGTENGVTFTSSGYNAPAGTNLTVTTNGALPGRGLIWQTDYGTGTSQTATVTITFSRPLNSFSMTVSDIDQINSSGANTGWRDQLQVDGYTAANVKVTLPAANVATASNGANTYAGNNLINGQGNFNSVGPEANVVITFPQAINRIVLTYRNTQTTVTDPGNQFVGIHSFSWCSEADVATTLSGPARAASGTPVTYTVSTTNNGPDEALSVIPTLQLSPNTVVTSRPTGSTYVQSTGLLTFATTASLASGSTLTNAVTFTMPATGSVTGKASNTSTNNDLVTTNDNGSLANANVTTAQDVRPVANNVTTAAILSTANATNISSLSATDADDATSTLTYQLTSLPTGGTLLINGAAAVTGVNYTATQATQLSFNPNGSTSGNVTFTYTATDPFGGVSNGATYTIPLTAVADVYATISGPANSPALSTVSLTATFGNNGPQTSTTTTRQVTLPAGVSNVVAAGSSNISGNVLSGYTITYPSVSLASGASNQFTITYTAPISGSVQATATAGTNINQGGATGNDSQSVTTNISAVADVTTTLSGQTLLGTGIASGTYTATFSNNGPSTASNVTRTVTLPAGVSSVVVPTGANYNTGTRQIDFGTATLLSGASSSFQFSFTAPTTASTTASIVSNVGTSTSQGADDAPNSATLGTPVRAIADVATTISASPTTATAGDVAFINVTFTNPGSVTAADVTRSVQLPSGLNVVGVSGGGTYDPATGVVTYPVTTTFAAGNNLNSTITLVAPTTGPIVAVSNIGTSSNQGELLTNDQATLTLNVTAGFDVATQISGPTSTVAGSLTTFAVVTRNNGALAASNVVQTVQLPTGLSNVYVSNNGVYNSGNGRVTFPTIASLAGGISLNNTISFNAPTAGFTASASVTPTAGDSNTGNNTSTATATTVSAATTGTLANVYTTISTTSTNVDPATSVTFTVVTGNAGQATAANVVQRVSLPAGLTGVTASNGGTYDANTGVVTFSTIASQLAGNTVSNTITVNAPAAGTLMAMANVASATSETVQSDNTATATVTINPVRDVVINLLGPTSADAGQALSYVVTTRNNSALAAANVVQTVQIPAGLTGVTVSGGGTYNATSGLVTFAAIASQAAGNVQTNTITFNAPAALAGSFISTASVTTDNAETSVTNNASSVTTTVQRSSDLTVKVNGPSTAIVGNPVTYNVATINNGTSVAASQTTTVQLPADLTDVTVSGGGTYTAATGVVTFAAVTNQAIGANGAVANTITFTAPAAAQVVVSANVTTTAATNEDIYSNNSAFVATTLNAATAASADVQTEITANLTSQTAGAAVTFTVRTINAAASASAAAQVVQRVQLPAGLTGVTASGSGTYDPTTGVVTFPAITSQAIGNTTTNTITLNVPGVTTLTATASVSSSTTETSAANNIDVATVTVNRTSDMTVSLSGPTTFLAGQTLTYTATTTNNGPSPAASQATTIQLPTGLTGVVVSSGNYNSGNGRVTFATVTNQGTGAVNEVINTVSFPAPSAASTLLTATVTPNAATNDTDATNNTSTLTLTRDNLAPVAYDVVNTLSAPQGNSAGALAISALNGTDADGTITRYNLTSVPASGTLYLGTTALTVGSQITAAQAGDVTFDPAAGFTGNVFFGYTAYDGGMTSAPALYTISVAQDINSVYTPTPSKGGTLANAYQNGDVIANVFDVNGGRYTNNGTTTTIGDTGVRTATTNAAGTTTLSGLGLTMDPVSGIISVTNRNLLRAGSYSLNVTTVDVSGGTNTQTVSFTIGLGPLPVELVEFTAKAQTNDALLTWKTAQEKNNRGFEVERSIDGKIFEKVTEVAGHGTTSTAQQYGFTDEGAARLAATVYYRLKQVDFDGTATTTDVRVVSFGKQAGIELALYPNPAVEMLNVRLLGATEASSVLIYNTAGSLVLQGKVAGSLSTSLDVRALPAGTYLVKVQGANGLNLSRRFVKN